MIDLTVKIFVLAGLLYSAILATDIHNTLHRCENIMQELHQFITVYGGEDD